MHAAASRGKLQPVGRRPEACHKPLGSACQSRYLTISSHVCLSCERIASGRSEHAEHEQGERACTSRGRHAWQRPRRRPFHAMSARARAPTNLAAGAQPVALTAFRRRKQELISALTNRARVFNRDRDSVRATPECRFEPGPVQRRSAARAFAAPLLPFSQKQSFHTRYDYLAVQRVDYSLI